jgi:hypothetical protein
MDTDREEVKCWMTFSDCWFIFKQRCRSISITATTIQVTSLRTLIDLLLLWRLKYHNSYISSERLICEIISSFFFSFVFHLNWWTSGDYVVLFLWSTFTLCRQRVCKQHRHCNSNHSYCISCQLAKSYDRIKSMWHTHLLRCVIETY